MHNAVCQPFIVLFGIVVILSWNVRNFAAQNHRGVRVAFRFGREKTNIQKQSITMSNETTKIFVPEGNDALTTAALMNNGGMGGGMWMKRISMMLCMLPTCVRPT